jgi:hypothetical protein
VALSGALSATEGDCKDFAFVKYPAVLQAGFADQDVKPMIVRDALANQNHVIVTVRLNGVWIVLDNRWLALVHDIQLRRTFPLYVLDGNDLISGRLQLSERALQTERRDDLGIYRSGWPLRTTNAFDSSSSDNLVPIIRAVETKSRSELSS